jgi:hypothetical protein
MEAAEVREAAAATCLPRKLRPKLAKEPTPTTRLNLLARKSI